ncbi:MAG TPA: nitroreductase/quinone reductase family protein [Candidatus Dormibacteraeota bacterium]|nr:nitroreductase/quinone reductase family protein [Candidatus Dormibacteraeota bacterium]
MIEQQQPASTTVSRFNRVVKALLRSGIPIPGFRLLTVTGRRSGEPRTTPVTPFSYEGRRYVMQGWPGAGWVANARAAGWGLLGVGRRMRRVTLTEIPVEERRPILRHNGRRAPKRVARMFVANGLIASTDAESWAAAAPAIAVFRLEDA